MALGGWLRFSAIAVTTMWVACHPAATVTYVEAMIDSSGQLRILAAGGDSVVPARDSTQVGFAAAAIAPNGRAVGWLAQYSNCCTSYPIPLALVVLSGTGTRTFTGTGLPVWRWRFERGGEEVAFEQETVHGGQGVHYELHDVATGALRATWEPGGGSAPSWVDRLDAGNPVPGGLPALIPPIGADSSAACGPLAGLLSDMPRRTVSVVPDTTLSDPRGGQGSWRRRGCFVLVVDTISRDGAPVGVLEEWFRANGWVDVTAFGADGPDGTMMGFFRPPELCILEGRWDGGDDSDSTVVPEPGYRLSVGCVPATAADTSGRH